MNTKYSFEGIVNNIEAFYLQHKPAPSDWYVQAHSDVQKLANCHGISLKVAAAVVAVLSPRVKWAAADTNPNLDAANNLIRGFRHKKHGKGIIFSMVAGFHANKEKAWKILRTGDITYCSGPKVSAFCHNLIDPYDDTYVTIDSWMTCIAFNLDLAQNKVNVAPTPKQQEQIVEALKVVAYSYDFMNALQFQASLWESAQKSI